MRVVHCRSAYRCARARARHRVLSEDTKNLAAKRSRTVWIVSLVIVAILVVAWIDGGEEPLRQITQPVDLPEGAQ